MSSLLDTRYVGLPILENHRLGSVDESAEPIYLEVSTRVRVATGLVASKFATGASASYCAPVHNTMTTSYEVVVSFDLDVGTFLEPDGKYQVELCESGVRMRNHLFNGFFRYDNIVRAYLLPHHVGETKDECESKVFVIHLQEPVLKGKRSYKCLVLQLTKEPHDVDVDMTKWAKYVELRPSMKQRLYFLFPRIFSIISGQSVFPEYDFKNRSHKSSVECSLGGNRGYLYPLHSSIMFLHNPTVIVGYDKIKSLAFLKHARQRGLYPTFSLQFLIDEHCASVFGCSSTTLTISGVSSDDYLYLQPFLSKIFGKKKYKIPIKNHYDEEVVDECKGHNTAGIGDDDALGSEYGSDDDEDAEQGTESDNIEQPVPSGAGTSTKRNKSKGASSNDVIDDKPSKKKTKPTEDDAEPPAAKKHIKKRIGSFFRFTKENYSRVAEMNPDARTPAERVRTCSPRTAP